MSNNRVMQVAGSLTFTTLLALVPLLTVTLTMMSALPIFSVYSSRVEAVVLSVLVPQFADKVITVYVQQFMDNAAKLTAAGIVMLLVTSIMLLSTIERTFNSIWVVQRTRPWWQQGVIYWVILTLGPVAVGGGLLVWHQVFHMLPLPFMVSLPASLLEISGTVLFTSTVLCVVYRMVPDRFVPLSHALLGAVITALLLEVAKAAFGLYLNTIASYQLIYGAFASLPVFLLWIYVLWLVILVGAVLTASMPYWAQEAWRRRIEPERHFLDALQILIMLDRAQTVGKALTVADLHSSVPIGFDELGQVLEQLSDGYIQRGQNGSWVLLKKLSAIRLSELFQQFVYRLDSHVEGEIGYAVEVELAPMRHSLEALSLQELAERLVQK